MKKLLCRHRDEDLFKKIGFGVIHKHLDEKQAIVEWLLSGRMNFMMKKYLYILDDNEIDGYRREQ